MHFFFFFSSVHVLVVVVCNWLTYVVHTDGSQVHVCCQKDKTRSIRDERRDGFGVLCLEPTHHLNSSKSLSRSDSRVLLLYGVLGTQHSALTGSDVSDHTQHTNILVRTHAHTHTDNTTTYFPQHHHTFTNNAMKRSRTNIPRGGGLILTIVQLESSTQQKETRPKSAQSQAAERVSMH